MDIGHTYATPTGERVMLYTTEDFTVPERIELDRDGTRVTFSRLLPSSIYCGDVVGVSGHCTSADCHRLPLGECQCGRHGRDAEGHKVPVKFIRAVR